MELKVGVPYIVTKGSDDGTLEKGDHIQLYDNGDIGCREAQGWIDKEKVEEAIKGMEVEVDKETLNKHKSALLDAFTQLAQMQPMDEALIRDLLNTFPKS